MQKRHTEYKTIVKQASYDNNIIQDDANSTSHPIHLNTAEAVRINNFIRKRGVLYRSYQK